jgi:hypothetical protein
VGAQPLETKDQSRLPPICAPAERSTWVNFSSNPGTRQTAPFERQRRLLEFPTDHLDPTQVRLAYGFGRACGYKSPALIGLYWLPPYLHDGGVTVGPEGELGPPQTVYRFLRPDPQASLRALLDRELRAGVVAANRADPRLRLMQ